MEAIRGKNNIFQIGFKCKSCEKDKILNQIVEIHYLNFKAHDVKVFCYIQKISIMNNNKETNVAFYDFELLMNDGKKSSLKKIKYLYLLREILLLH